MLGSYTIDYAWEGGRAGEGRGALLLVGSQQCVKKLKKIDYNVVFFLQQGD